MCVLADRFAADGTHTFYLLAGRGDNHIFLRVTPVSTCQWAANIPRILAPIFISLVAIGEQWLC